MDKETFLDIVTQKETWDLTELLDLIGMTPDELTAYLLGCKNELECKVEGLYTCQGFPLLRQLASNVKMRKDNRE